MKVNDSITGLFIFLSGVVVGICLPLLFCSHEGDSSKEITHSDTTYVYEMVTYSKIDLEANSQRFEIPKISTPKLVVIPEDSVTVIYKDSIKYVALQRQYFYTNVDDVEIWHSGIDSTIDSLNVVRKTQEITKTTQTKPKLNSIGIGIETNYMSCLSTPIYIEYERTLKPWLSVYGQIAYDLPSQKYGAGVGLKMSIGW